MGSAHVGSGANSSEHEGIRPQVEIDEVRPELGLRQVIEFSVRAILVDATKNEFGLLLAQELVLVGEVLNEVEGT